MTHRQVVVAACSREANVTAWDLSTGAPLLTFKPIACGPNALCSIGRDYLMGAERTKGMIRSWSWDKGALLHDSFVVEPIHALAASLDGLYVAGGGKSGTLHLWETATGRLLRSWVAHYKAVTALTLLTSGNVLISGSEDATVNVWILAEVLDGCLEANRSRTKPMPFRSWSEHTLPVTGLCCGLGDANAIVVSSSLDCSCKIWCVGSGQLLRTCRFPCPVVSVLLDQGEHCMYAGGKDGRIFEVSLVNQQEGLGDQSWVPMSGHARAVACLAISGDGLQLLSGSEDGTVRVWDIPTHQCVKVLNSSDKSPVSCLLVVHSPPLPKQESESKVARQNRHQPLRRFSKFAGPPGDSSPWHGSPIMVDGSVRYHGLAQHNGLLTKPAESGDSGWPITSLISAAKCDAEMQAELKESQSTIQRLRDSHSKMLQFCTSKILSSAWQEASGSNGIGS